ncbi:MAG: ATP-binding protein [Candidatus Micrarchaeota archaeon]|nr:ATP-binding protein [Candidatus Micrarchaeota archaeon]MCX8154719.1 ATP-binding protein [Candidatus Micrarchaeota archaeon]
MISRSVDSIFSTKDIVLPNDPIDQIIGQEEAVRIAKIAVQQRRHLLLVGPPGVGKSMIAKAMAQLLPRPKEQIYVQNNPRKPERPIVRVERIDNDIDRVKVVQIGLEDLSDDVAERMNIKCRNCGKRSEPSKDICPYCMERKFIPQSRNIGFMDMNKNDRRKNYYIKTNISESGTDIIHTVYFIEDDKVYRFIKSSKDKLPDWIESKISPQNDRKIIVPFNRSLFVQAIAKTESELFGDIEHDPYGAHPELGIPYYARVMPGAVHEAHEGILFIDELSTMEPHIQRALLTAMQEKRFSISAKNPMSSGAFAKVENVPCDFILVGAINVMDIGMLHPALRSRISGYGYEILLNTWMPITEENIYRTYQFVAQEIKNDGKIPHAHISALNEIIKISKSIARSFDDVQGLTLRLRYLGGIVRAAGDLAILDGEEYILAKHIREAAKISRPVESQIRDVIGNNWWKNLNVDYGNYNRRNDEGDVR